MPLLTEHSAPVQHTAADVRRQLEALVSDDALRTSRRSVAFLRYIVEQTLLGNADELMERTKVSTSSARR